MSKLAAFEVPQKHINWANAAVEEAEEIAERFIKTDGMASVIEVDPQSGDSTYKIVQKSAIPDSVERKYSEAVHWIKDSFDQSIHAARQITQRGTKAKVYFPWAQGPGADLSRAFASNHVPPEFWDVIRSLQPYPTGQLHIGGDDVVRKMANIANRKHTVGLSFSCISRGAFQNAMRTTGGPVTVHMPQWDSVKNEVKLFTIGPTTKLDPNYDYAVNFQIVFDATSPLAGFSAHFAVSRFAAKAQHALNALRQRCSELGAV